MMAVLGLAAPAWAGDDLDAERVLHEQFDLGSPKPCDVDADCWDSAFGEWCDPTTMTCTFCRDTAECVSPDEVCQQQACVVPCQTDDDCTMEEPRCDPVEGRCAECLGSEDCDADEFCDDSRFCGLDRCTPGDRSCSSGLRIGVCRADGSGYEEETLCEDTLLCMEIDDVPQCLPADGYGSSTSTSGGSGSGSSGTAAADVFTDSASSETNETRPAEEPDRVTDRGCVCTTDRQREPVWLLLPLLLLGVGRRISRAR